MKYIKFVAKQDSWFEIGTEVFVGYHNGLLDGELCPLDEFNITIVNKDCINIKR
jgi:hypothetical protein